jgi:hypothetical protein
LSAIGSFDRENWIGAKRVGSSNNFVNVDGSEAFLPWSIGEPNNANAGDENCVEAWRNGDGVNDQNCYSGGRQYSCRIDSPPRINQSREKCVANPQASTRDICSASKWACYDQQYAPDMRRACTTEWQDCCYRNQCNKEKLIDLCTTVFDQYDSQLRDNNSCDFGGAAYRVNL